MSENKYGTKSGSVLSLVYVAMFTAIITICSQLQIPTGIPFTLQTLGVFVTGGLLGWKRAVMSVLVYILQNF